MNFLIIRYRLIFRCILPALFLDALYGFIVYNTQPIFRRNRRIGTIGILPLFLDESPRLFLDHNALIFRRIHAIFRCYVCIYPIFRWIQGAFS